jgi:hypothetical protein
LFAFLAEPEFVLHRVVLRDSQLLLEIDDLSSKGSVLVVTAGAHIAIYRGLNYRSVIEHPFEQEEKQDREYTAGR